MLLLSYNLIKLLNDSMIKFKDMISQILLALILKQSIIKPYTIIYKINSKYLQLFLKK